jgi:hypothetical protein
MGIKADAGIGHPLLDFLNNLIKLHFRICRSDLPQNGTELFYISEDRTLMAVPVQLASSASQPVQVGQPKPLFRVPVLDNFIVGRSYEAGNDGHRFLMLALASGATAPPLTVVLNLAESVEGMNPPQGTRRSFSVRRRDAALIGSALSQTGRRQR